MKPEENANSVPMNNAVQQDLKRAATWFGVPLVLVATLYGADQGLDKMEQGLLVLRTREKAALLAKDPCEVKSFTPRKRFKYPSKRRVEYECGKTVLDCGRNQVTQEYECKRRGRLGLLGRKFKEMAETVDEIKSLTGK